MAQKPALFWKFNCPLYLLQDMVLHSTVFWLIFQFFRAQQNESNSPLFVIVWLWKCRHKMPLFEWHRKRSLQLLHSKGKIIGNLKNNSNLLYIYISFFLVKIDSQRLGLNLFMPRQRFIIKEVNDCALACVMTSPPLHKSSLERKPVKLLFFESRCLKNTKFILHETETKYII